MTSRLVRPRNPRPIALTQRDRAVVEDVAHFGVVTAAHIRALHFAGIGLRAVQSRLRRLFEHRFLDRLFFPRVFAADGPREAMTPVYCLGRRGAALVGDDAIRAHVDAAALQHDLVGVDLLVALRLAHGRTAVTEPEHVLWRRVAVARTAEPTLPRVVVPDAAFTIPEGSFAVEVVRASVRGGNRSVVEKLARYASLHHTGVLARVFKWQRLRAVLVLTPTPARASQLRALAARTLVHGRFLFWFGHWQLRPRLGVPVTIFGRDSITTALSVSITGEPRSLSHPHHV